MALNKRIAKLEKSRLILNPYVAKLRKMSDEELLAELGRVKARAAMMDCPTDGIINAPFTLSHTGVRLKPFPSIVKPTV